MQVSVISEERMTAGLSNWEKRKLLDYIRGAASPHTILSKQAQGFQLLNIERAEVKVAKRALQIFNWPSQQVAAFMHTLDNQLKAA